MASGCFRFDRFTLDPADRQLLRGGAALDLNSRYFDALELMVREAGRLVPKERFLDEVWRGVPVTDEALTQCIRSLRKQLGDDASRPRFIETVPKHGYRFIAPVDAVAETGAVSKPARDAIVQQTVASTLGGMVAGLVGGLFYGFAGASASGAGAASTLIVLAAVTTILATIGAAGVGLGIALAAQRGWSWTIVGSAIGGLVVGALVKLLALDALRLLFGAAPRDITGALEGLILGAGVGAGLVLARRKPRSARLSATIAAGCGATAGLLCDLAGGRLMGGSLDHLARTFPASQLRLDGVGALFGEAGFGPVSQLVTAALEGALFAGCIVAAWTVAARRVRGG